MTGHMIDFSYAHAKFTGANIKAAGVRGVARYLGGRPDKRLTADEAKDYLAHGLWILTVYEDGAQRAGGGYLLGMADATEANKQADAVGIPKTAAIMYAVDYDADPKAVKPYFEGLHARTVRDGLRPVGVYGGFRIADAGLATWVWQTQAWSGGKVSTKANILQKVTRTFSIKGAVANDWDENDILYGVIPVWRPTAPKSPAPAPPPAPKPAPVPHTSRGKTVDEALALMQDAWDMGDPVRREAIDTAVKAIEAVKYVR